MEKRDMINAEIKFIVTMDIAFEMLEKGMICVAEYEEFLEQMSTKYGTDNLRILYQFKLDIYLEKRVNTSAKGVD